MHYLDDAEIGAIHSLATGTDQYALEKGTYSGSVKRLMAQDEVRIVLAKTSVRPHAFVWQKVAEVSRAAGKKVDGNHKGAADLVVECAAGEKRWDTPSSVRNEWNYKDARLYGARGDQVAEEHFVKIVGSSERAERWARGRRGKSGPAGKVAAVAFVNHTLVEAVKEAHRFLLPTEQNPWQELAGRSP